MRQPGRRAAGWTTLVAGLGALTVGAVLALRPPPAPPDTGRVPTVVAAVPVPSVPAPSGPAPRWTPDEVVIPRLPVGAPVDAVGVSGGGALDVPGDPDRLGWWIGSALPGDPRGTVLIAGHVDTARDGRGALYRLEKLPVGSRVEVRAGGRTVAYRVAARRSYVKSRLPKALFRRDGPAQLVLITCGGDFRAGAYDHNVVVYATPEG